MSEFSNSTITLKNESSLSKKKEPSQYGSNANNIIQYGKNMEMIPEQNESEGNKTNINIVDPSMYGFEIDAVELEKIISKYKEITEFSK